MASFWEHVNLVLRQADIIIEVLDARMVEETRNREIEGKVRREQKQLLYVMNKCDLVPLEQMKRAAIQLKPSVFISSTQKWGTTILKKKIMELAGGKAVVVGVVGYPNVGKSSLINALAGRAAARTSTESGFTKGLQKVRVGGKILLLDTPGVFPAKEKRGAKHVLMGAISREKLKDVETAALELIELRKKPIATHYGVEEDEPEEILEKIAVKFRKFRRGGMPDTDAAARMVLKEWQAGKIR